LIGRKKGRRERRIELKNRTEEGLKRGRGRNRR
jgi:hypothetical protein